VKSFLEISYCIFEDLNAVSLLVGKGLVLAKIILFHAGPIRVVCEVIEGLRVGHKPENPACRIADSSDVQKGAIWIKGPLPFCG